MEGGFLFFRRFVSTSHGADRPVAKEVLGISIDLVLYKVTKEGLGWGGK